MDETPFWYDMMQNKTVDKLGAKSVDVASTGNEKSRYTVVASVAASGNFLRTMIVFRGN